MRKLLLFLKRVTESNAIGSDNKFNQSVVNSISKACLKTNNIIYGSFVPVGEKTVKHSYLASYFGENNASWFEIVLKLVYKTLDDSPVSIAS